MHDDRIYVNTRSLSAGLSGVQRYTLEVTSRISDEIHCVAPQRNARAAAGHLWEQVKLPRLLGDSLLWSPANTGPMGVRRQVVTIHDLSALDHPEWFSRAFAAWYRVMVPRLAASAAAIITDSRWTADRLMDRLGVGEEKIHVVPCGVDERFRPAGEEEISSARSSLGLGQEPYLLSLSSLEPRKNLRRLLQAWALALPDLPAELRLVVAGAAGGRHVFGDFRMGELPPRVVLTGHVGEEQLPALLSGAVAMAYPSIYEGFGLPPLEAMATGTPVISGNRTSLPEVVGAAAILVDPHDVSAIASSIVQVVRDEALRSHLGERGLDRARQFTWDNTAAGVLAVLQSHR